MANLTASQVPGKSKLKLTAGNLTRETHATRGEIVTLTRHYVRRDPDADHDGEPDRKGQTEFFLD